MVSSDQELNVTIYKSIVTRWKDGIVKFDSMRRKGKAFGKTCSREEAKTNRPSLLLYIQNILVPFIC